MPSFGGVNIFGTAVTMSTADHPREKQVNSFFGVSGLETLDGGMRGRTTTVSGVLSGQLGGGPRGRGGDLPFVQRRRRADPGRHFGTAWASVRLESFQPTGRVRQSAVRGLSPALSGPVPPPRVRQPMPFSQSSHHRRAGHARRRGIASSPGPRRRRGATFQVYVDRRLAWSGTSRSCHVPSPPGAAGRNRLGRGRHRRPGRGEPRLLGGAGRAGGLRGAVPT